MSPVYTHTESVFNPTTFVDREKFEARLNIFGRRLERYCRTALWERTDCPDDLEDATQVGMIALWQEYQKDPSFMDLDDRAWFKIAKRAAFNHLSRMLTQRGTPRGKKAFVVTEAEYTSSTDESLLEMAERRHVHKSPHLYRAEAEQADKRIDLAATLKHVLQQMTEAQQELMGKVIPLIAEGYTFTEIASQLNTPRTHIRYHWEVLRVLASQHTKRPLENLPSETHTGQKLTDAQIAAIRAHVKSGATSRAIAAAMDISPSVVLNYIPTQLRKGATNHRRVTPEILARFQHLAAAGISPKNIGAATGFSSSTVNAYLNRRRTPTQDAPYLTLTERAEIQHLRQQGMSIPKIAQTLNRSETTIRRWLPNDDRLNKRITPEQRQQMHVLYAESKNVAEIARQVGVTRASVARILNTARPKGEPRQLSPEQRDELIRQRQQGMSLAKLSQQFRCRTKAILANLPKSLHPQKQTIGADEVRQMQHLHQTGLSMSDIGKHFSLNRNRVAAYLKNPTI